MADVFIPNPAMIAELKELEGIKLVMAAVAPIVADAVREVAPRGTGHHHYADSIQAVDSTVESTYAFSHIVEFGSINNPPYAPLRRGVIAAGLRFEDDSAP